VGFLERNPPRFLSLFEETPGFEIPEDPPHGGGRNSETLFPEEDSEALPSKKWELLPEFLDSLHKLRGPARLSDLCGSSGSAFRAMQSFAGDGHRVG